MSANSVGSFMQELLETAKAAAKLPDIEAELKRAQDQIIADGQRIARLESKLMVAKDREDELNAKLRSVEAERDNAGFRELEATDREDNLKRVIRDCQIAMGEAMKALEPITAEPASQSEPFPTGQSVTTQIPVVEPDTVTVSKDTGEHTVDPTIGATPSTQSQPVQTSGTESSAVVEPFAPYLGEQPKPMEDGELNPRPTQATVPSTDATQPTDATLMTVEHSSAVPSTAEVQEVPPQPDPTPNANGQPASAKSTTESASAPPSDDWWPRVSQASNYSG